MDTSPWQKVFCAPLPMQPRKPSSEGGTYAYTHKHFSWIILQGSAGREEQTERYVSEILYRVWYPAKLLWWVPLLCAAAKPNVESIAGLLVDEFPLISSRPKAQIYGSANILALAISWIRNLFFLSPGLGSLSFAEFSILKRQQYHVSLIPYKGFSGRGIIYSDIG